MATLASKTMIYRGLGSGIIRVMKEGVKVEFVNEESANQFKTIIWRTTQKSGKKFLKEGEEFLKGNESTTQKSGKEFLKEDKEFLKEFLKAKEIIHSMILAKPETTTGDMVTKIGVSDRQVRKYIKKLIDLGFLKREGGRKHGHWIVTLITLNPLPKAVSDYTDEHQPGLYLVKAEGACPPEDCGGVWGYANLLELKNKNRKTREEKDRLEWYGIDKHYDEHDPNEEELTSSLEDLWNEATE